MLKPSEVFHRSFRILVLRGMAMIIRLQLRSPGAVEDEKLLEDIADYIRSESEVEAQPPASAYRRLEYRRPER